jgi:hypothetical protein
MKILSIEDIEILEDAGVTITDLKAMSDVEIETILGTMANYDQKRVRQSEEMYSIWGISPAF